MILIFGLLQGAALANQTVDQNQSSEKREITVIIYKEVASANQGQLSEKEKWDLIEKAVQDMALLNLSFQLQTEKDAAERGIRELEKFQTSDAALKEKINKNWLPAFKKYIKAVENTLAAIEKFKERRDFIPYEEIEAELRKQYPEELETRIKQVLKEMDEMGILQKLLQD